MQRQKRVRFFGGVAAVVACVGSMVIAFTNCSRGFEVSSEFMSLNLSQSTLFSINAGEEYTKFADVTLNFKPSNATDMYVTEDPTCASGGTWESAKSSRPWTLTKKNTENILYVLFRNSSRSDVVTPCRAASIIHDDVVPTLTAVKSVLPFTNQQTAKLEFTSSDVGSGIATTKCLLDGKSADDCLSSFSASMLAEGSHELRVSVTDRAGNAAADLVQTVVVDLTPPQIMLNMSPPKITNQTSALFRYSATDALSGVDHFECKLDADVNFVNCIETNSMTVREGAHTFSVRAVDRAGNPSSLISYAWVVDLTAPTMMITKTPGTFSNVAKPSFEFKGTDMGMDVASIECSVDSSAPVPCSSPLALKVSLNEGVHTFAVRGTDTAGNVSELTTYRWTIDLTPPVLTLTNPPDNPNHIAQLSIGYVSTDTAGGANSGLDHVTCEIDGKSFATCANPFSYFLKANGDYTLKVQAFDKAGNASAMTIVNFTADLPPFVEYTIASPPVIGQPFTLKPVVTGGAVVSFTPLMGKLPPGLKLDTVTGVISGTPLTKSRGYFVYFKASNAAGSTTASVFIAIPDDCMTKVVGKGTEADPYLVKTVRDMYCIDASPKSAWALDTNLTINPQDAANYDSAPWVVSNMSGGFDGRFHEITYNVDCLKQDCDRDSTKNDISIFGGIHDSKIQNLSVKFSYANIDAPGRKTFTQYAAGLAVSMRSVLVSKISVVGTVQPTPNSSYPQVTAGLSAYDDSGSYSQVRAGLTGPDKGAVAPIVGLIGGASSTLGHTTAVSDSFAEGDLKYGGTFGGTFAMLVSSPNAGVPDTLKIKNSYYRGNFIAGEICGSGVQVVAPPSAMTTVTLDGFFFSGTAACKGGVAFPLSPIAPTQIPTVIQDLKWDATIWEKGSNGLPSLIWLKNIVQ